MILVLFQPELLHCFIFSASEQQGCSVPISLETDVPGACLQFGEDPGASHQKLQSRGLSVLIARPARESAVPRAPRLARAAPFVAAVSATQRVKAAVRPNERSSVVKTEFWMFYLYVE